MAKIKATIKKDSPAADIIKAAKAEKQAFKEAVEAGNNKQQTAITWLINELIQNRLMALRYDADNTFNEIYKKAKQMEKEQLENVIKEIADEDIKRKIKKEYNYTHYEDRLWMVQGAVWYREQLNKMNNNG